MKNTLGSFLKKYLLFIIILLALPLGLVRFFEYKHGGSISSSDWLVFCASILAYIGTTLLSLVALYQSERANRISELAYEMSTREQNVAFQIETVETVNIQSCQYHANPRLIFCKVESTPMHCQGYKLKVRNCGVHAITNIVAKTTYAIGRNGLEETLERETKVVLQPNNCAEVFMCNTPCFEKYRGYVEFLIRCENAYNYTATIKLKIDRSKMSADGKEVLFSCELMD